MKHPDLPRRRYAWIAFSCVTGLLALPSLSAQTVNPAPVRPIEEEKPVELSPFQVRSERDNGYVATNTLAGSRLNTSLRDTPASISVMTKDFLDDIGALSVTAAMAYSVNGGFDITAGATDNRGGDTGNRLLGSDYNFQVRGFRSATQTRNYFVTALDGDAYNIERIDVARGPNSLLFGVGGPSGVVNTTTKQADPTRNFGQISTLVASFNKERYALDVNQGLLNKRFGVRTNLLYQKADGYHDFEADNQKRGALALTWKITDSTTLRVSGEIGELDQNRVRPWSAVDNYSKWADAGRPMYAFGTPQSPAGNLAPIQSDAVINDQNFSQSQSTAHLGGVANGRTADEFYTGQTGMYNLFLDGPLAGRTLFLGGDPSMGGAVGSNRGARYYRVSNGYGNISGFDTPFPVLDETIYPRTANVSGPGQRVLIDYHNMGATLEQRIGSNLNIEATVNRTQRESEQRTVLGFNQISVTLDAMAYLPTFRDDFTYAASLGGPTTTGQGRGALNFGPTVSNLMTGEVTANPRGGGLIANPNAGKMMLNYNPSYSLNKQVNDDARVSASYRLDLGKFGEHSLLAFGARSEVKSESKGYAIGNLDPRRSAQNVTTNVPLQFIHVDPTSANLADRGIPDPWKSSLNVQSQIYGVSSVVPGQAYTQEFYTPGFYQSGWSTGHRKIDSAAVAAHSRFFDGHLITTVGGRRDRIRGYGQTRTSDEATTITTGLNPKTQNLNVAGDTYSAGAVYHIPVKSFQWLSVFANKSTNFQDQGTATRFEDFDERQSLEIGPLKGIGLDYGLKASLLDGRINATLTRFSVDQENVSSGVGSSAINNYINAIWTAIQNGGPATVQRDQDNPTGHRVGGNETRTQESTGWELEVTANPTKNWRLSFNISKSDNVVSKLGTNVVAYVEKHRATWMQHAGLNYDTGSALSVGILNNAGGSNTIGALVHGLDNVYIPFIKGNEGTSLVGIRPWNANTFTSYRFTEGFLKNLTIGGGVNYRGEQIIGMRLPTVQDPTYEVFKGHVSYQVNSMVSYEFKLRNRNSIKLQLNVNNLLDNDDLQVLSSSYNPTLQKIDKFYYHNLPRTYSLSATLNF
jgi:outer membrane receptor for ferric coprogen and ferric-rhodotorulic acid